MRMMIAAALKLISIYIWLNEKDKPLFVVLKENLKFVKANFPISDVFLWKVDSNETNNILNGFNFFIYVYLYQK